MPKTLAAASGLRLPAWTPGPLQYARCSGDELQGAAKRELARVIAQYGGASASECPVNWRRSDVAYTHKKRKGVSLDATQRG